MSITILFICFIFFIVMGVPIPFILGFISLIYVIITGNYSMLLNITQKMFTGVDKTVLLCIPLFMLAGNLMNEGNMTERLVNFSKSTVGSFRGGLAHTNVLASMFFAGITGSALADTSAIGGIMIPAMVKDGYDEDFSVAVTVASSCIGPIIPPSMMFIVYCFLANVSVGSLFLAGCIPGVLMGLSQMSLIAFYSKKRNYPKAPFQSFRVIWKGFKNAILALIMPLIILGGIFSGIFTATEAGAVAVVYALIVSSLVYRRLTFPGLLKAFLNSAIQTAVVLFVLANASGFAWVITVERVPALLANFLQGITHEPIIILLLINLLLLFIGTWMDATASLIIMTPILLPIVTNLGIDPIHFGIIICLNLVLGLITPPVGPCLFIASTISGISIERIFKATFPFLLVNIAVLLLVTYFPEITLFLPKMFGFN